MVEEPPSLEPTDGTGEQFRAGDRVQIVLGVLSGLVGVVVRRTSSHKYLLTIDGLAQGVHVVVAPYALERIGPS